MGSGQNEMFENENPQITDSNKKVTEPIESTDSPTFEPKFGSTTRDKLREKLREQLENEKSKGFELGHRKDTNDLFDPSDEPVFDSAFSDFDITSQKQAPTTARISFDKENFNEIKEVDPSQPQSRSQRRISHKTAQGPLVTRIRSRFRHSNPVRKRSNNSNRKRTVSFRTLNEEVNQVRKQRRGKSASPAFYNPRRRRRQPINAEPITENIDYDDTLFRVGRSTIVDSHMTSGPQEGQHTDTYITATTSMDSMEEETTQRMATNEQQETFMTDESIVTEPTTIDLFKDTTTESIVEKKEKSIFKDRYKDNILSRLRSKNELNPSESNIQNRFSRFRPGLPSSDNKEHDEKVSGPNIDPSKGIQIIDSKTNEEKAMKNDSSAKAKESKQKSKFSKHKSALFSRRRSKVFQESTTISSSVTETTLPTISQNKTTQKTVEKISKKHSNIFAHAKRPKFNSKYSHKFGQKRSSLFKHKPSVEKNSTSVKSNISLDSDSVTTPQPLSSTITSTPSNISSVQPNSSSPIPSPIKSSSSTRKRFQFRTGSNRSPLNNLFDRRNKNKKSQILSRLTTSTTPIEETTLSSTQEEKSSKGGEDVNTDESSTPFQPTVSDNLISTDASTQAPFFPTFVPVDTATEKSQTTPASVILIPKPPQAQPRHDNPRR